MVISVQMLPSPVSEDRNSICLIKEPQSSNLSVARIREQFPILRHHPETLFFDNASTTHKPLVVINAINQFNELECANAGRGSYSWSTRLASAVEDTRASLAVFMNADVEQVAFTTGATDSLNLVAQCWGLNNLKDGDEIMVCMEDHQSAVLPWLNLKSVLQSFGIQINIVPFRVHPSGTYDRKSIIDGLSERTRIVALSHMHHVYGMEMDIQELKLLIPQSVLVSLDASQSIGHIKVDVQKLGVDFVSFSGHKMFAANGVGGLWASKRALEQMNPARVGAKTRMLEGANIFAADRATLAGLIECGTLNLPAILSLGAAIKFIDSLDRKDFENHISTLTRDLVSRLKKIPGIEFAPGIGACDCTRGYGIIAFKFDSVRTSDLGAYLDSEDVFVRTGDHCLAKQSQQSDDYMRVSLQIYNTSGEIERFVEVLEDACG